ncbi:hypothetical protein [Methylotenera sp. N17]|jgi:hypothetical protein|uniref:hypothetical protein n=1 Tax=Methylotenera sp. N17 TaxID=1502761 RepID=UPI000A71C4FD|nr:hypothetical protein [Methylotenera sp. N17]
MINVKMKLAIFGVLTCSTYALALPGLVNIPVTGFATSAYTLCNTTGNFGSGIGAAAPVAPGAGTNDTCAYYPAPATNPTPPETGYTLVTSAARSIVVNNAQTGGVNKSVGIVNEYVWRKPATTTPVTPTPVCIYGAVTVMNVLDYDTINAGTQTFEINDLARGGFDNLSVEAGYAILGTTPNAGPVFRIGRTYTSVQHRAFATSPICGDAGGGVPGTGYLALPGFGNSAAVAGVSRFIGTAPISFSPPACLANPTATEQAADVYPPIAPNGSWIDFTLHVNAGNPQPLSPMTYVKAACTTAAPVTRPNAIRLRQTGQEKSPFISVEVTGFVPPTAPAVITPPN